MTKLRITLLALAALPSLLSTVSQAAPPHRPYHVTTIGWIVANRDNLDVDDNYVTIVGHVTRRIGDEEYWFTDGTGSVRLDSENFDLPVGTKLIIGGRIDQAYLGFGHLEVDVRHWHYAPAHKQVAAPPAKSTMIKLSPAAQATESAPEPAAPSTNTAPPLTPPTETAATNAAPAGK